MKRLFRKYWAAWLLFLLALLPRVIFPVNISIIGDVRRDYGEAIKMLHGEAFPLLGIPSSVPRFSQGPLNIWFDVLAFWWAGINPFSPVLAAAVFVSTGIVLFYKFLRRHLPGLVAFISALLWALSVGAIRQSRMPFYLFAEPVFVVIYIFALEKMKSDWRSVFWATLAFFLLFQWELATIPLIMLIFVASLRKRVSWQASILGFLGGSLVGLLPQIMYDLTHQCRQLCGFALWMGYRLAAVTGFDGRHGYTSTKITSLFQSIISSLQELVGVGTLSILLLIISVSLVSLFIKKKSELLVLTWIGTGLLLFGLFIHGDPSEAYFPPFLVLIPILFGFGLTCLKPKAKYLICAVLILLGLVSAWKQITSHFGMPEIYERQI